MNKVLHTRIYKLTRKSHGKTVVTYRGYYTLEKNGPRVWMNLGTPDKEIAGKRIMEIALRAQREQECMIAPRAERETAAKGLSQLVGEYETDLVSRGLVRKHIHDTTKRIRRVISETGWRVVADVTADSFVEWRGFLQASAKTKKEYQLSLTAFLNWLLRNDRIAANPLAKVDRIKTRGKQVRPYRPFTPEELSRLFAIAGKHQLAYQTLFYTGQRKSEVRALVWGDLHLDEEKPFALFREDTMKDNDKRAVPLRRELVELLKKARPAGVDPTKRVFWWCFPTYDLLLSHLKKAGIERKDGLGRVLHFHSFRKSLQSLGVKFGMNQRATQEILGHSDANLTAQAYTDVPSLQLHDEIAKLPWISAGESCAQHSAQKSGVSGQVVSLADILRQLEILAQATGTEGLKHTVALPVTSGQTVEMAARAGIEPATK